MTYVIERGGRHVVMMRSQVVDDYPIKSVKSKVAAEEYSEKVNKMLGLIS